ncbi:uncharacterized protein A4U43_C02F4460 [Asparagus officinalis]|uniref:F-box domain-containing protein n=1 Tax=Asparagus officinalis TaxID=4686 RepID=A0A5P1FGP1_ASPOF|nr:uncharacterized protein A4U43_C02F4460 [Asparagus officinalis]
MPCHDILSRQFADSEMCFSTEIQNKLKISTVIKRETRDLYCPILPGLPEDVAKFCLALVPRSYLPVMSTVCKKWRSFIQSKEFITVRKEAGKLEEWLYVLIGDAEGKGSHWEVLGRFGGEKQILPPMPGPIKAGFGVTVVNGKLLIMAGYSVDIGTACVSADVYQYDCRLNSWSTLAKMNIARFDFACTEVNGLIYVAGASQVPKSTTPTQINGH